MEPQLPQAAVLVHERALAGKPVENADASGQEVRVRDGEERGEAGNAAEGAGSG
jgi:hypothetical protein